MTTSDFFKVFTGVLLMTFLISPVAGNSQNDQISFSISTKNIYSPGENISLNVYSYGNYEKKKEEMISLRLRS
ncbi:MAG: hypothetical protein IPM38_17210 [Ignavibacteria bacterium]|nr:hypothetical protein [Ignavibacteria bacterium]